MIGTPNLTTALSTILTLLLSFASGLWLPISLMPDLIRNIAPYLPTYHLGQIAWIIVGSTANTDNRPLGVHLLILVAYAVVFARWPHGLIFGMRIGISPEIIALQPLTKN